jgi:hypothetical protein
MGERPELGGLLRPSLQRETEPAALLSEGASFLSSFIGGPFAALLVGGFNVRALGRLARDAWLLGLSLVFALFVTIVAADATRMAGGSTAATGGGPAFGVQPQPRPKTTTAILFGHELSTATLRRIVQGSGLLVFLAFFLRHRRFHRAQQITNARPARAWAIGLGAIAAGWALQAVVGLTYTAAIR